MVIDKKIVAGCSSSRENHRSAEAWVWTEPEFRRKGYARQCVRAWALGVLDLKKIPFYSHTSENTASRSLAASLGLAPVFDIVGYS